ncbi:DUF1036 domain-containing protein [Tumidithrix helvetica PCC 7403]|uniref:hypothetical protein n=1 Tax=Tumidithrix helvetica TaxID=3457545 RepID=UPI003CA6F050
MWHRNSLLKLVGIAAIALLTGAILSGDEANSAEIQAIESSHFPVNLLANGQTAIATLADGNYQFCTKPQPHDWRNGAGVCFNFAKIGDRLDGYYGYPHSDELICLRGKVDGTIVTGEALAISWAGREWTVIPQTAFKWDEAGHLTLDRGKIVRTSHGGMGRTDWILFRYAGLDTEGFYQYRKPLMTSPSQLCNWN